MFAVDGAKQKRAARTTTAQFLLYVETLELDAVFRTGKSPSGTAPSHNENVWNRLTTKLNSSGLGPVKNKEGWKKVRSCESNCIGKHNQTFKF